MSRPFHSCITRQNWSKMSELRQRAQKYRFWAQTPKDTKIEKSETVIPRVFATSFKEKKNYSNRTTRSMRLVGAVQGRHINVSVPVYSIDISKLEKILHLILAASPLASSGCSAIGDWKGQTLMSLNCFTKKPLHFREIQWGIYNTSSL